MNDLIQSLQNARKNKGLTQRQLAQAVGLPQGHISRIENGKTDVRLSTLIEMVRVLDHELLLIPQLVYFWRGSILSAPLAP
jgi:HTH-type transcriptional regulator/antitoxin HipB